MNQHELFALRSRHTREVARNAMDGLIAIRGPVDTAALQMLKSLQLDLDEKIKMLEELGHWSRPGDTGVKTATTCTTDQETPTTGSAFSRSGNLVDLSSEESGMETSPTTDAST